ncbi:peptidoglycan/LPS O-acetylase OafA/YrhL [Bosea sp. BK604]|nr:peptidoglycan/LPS O-acetylase OafA/YrhL [Bosea sp. BK604]
MNQIVSPDLAVRSDRYLAFVDGLRAISIVSVLLYHLDRDFVPNGYIGVDVFFVISGFVVSYAIAARKPLGFASFLADFYARRILRIAPALIVCLLLTSLLSFLFIPDAWLSSQQYKTAQMAFWGLSNVQLAQGTDYFSPVTEFNPFTHTWSLGVEEQFYLLFPLLFFPWTRSRSGRRYAVLAVMVGLMLSLSLWLYLQNVAPLKAFYMIYARFWQLAAGVACFQISAMLRDRNLAFPGAAPALAGLALLVVTLWLRLPPEHAWAINVLAVIATVVIIASLQQQGSRGIATALLEARPARFVGKISYSLYLWHWPVFVLARWTVGLVTPVQLAAATLLAFLLAVASYFFVERPVRRSYRLRAMPRYAVVALGLACVGASFGAFDYLRDNRSRLSLSTVMQNRELWLADSPRNSFADLPNCTIQALPAGAIMTYRRSGCPEGPSSSARVYFLGDSHAFSYIHLMKRLTLVTGIETVLVSTAGCPFLSLHWPREGEPDCVAAIRNASAVLLSQARPGDLIFMPSMRMPRLDDQFAQYSDESALKSVFGPAKAAEREKAIERAIDLLRPLAEKGVGLLFEAPKPIFRAPAYRCSDWFNRNNPACKGGLTIERDFVERLRGPILDAFHQISTKVPGVSVWDPLPTLCPGPSCGALLDGKPLFSDGDHISGFANTALTPSFVAAVTTILDRRR